MNTLFKIILTENVLHFLESLEYSHYEKILSNIRRAQVKQDADLFKKLSNDIWEFRTLYKGFQYRLFAFWDKTSTEDTLVVCTHGIVKKVSKVPRKEIEKAARIRNEYFNNLKK